MMSGEKERTAVTIVDTLVFTGEDHEQKAEQWKKLVRESENLNQKEFYALNKKGSVILQYQGDETTQRQTLLKVEKVKVADDDEKKELILDSRSK
jgi:hypothetical protein